MPSRHNGRVAPPEKLHPFTSEDTGRTVQVRKISTLLRAEVRRQVIAQSDFAKPDPPMSEVDYGDGKIRVPNPAHPVYQQLIRDWNIRVNEAVGARLKEIAIRRAVVCEVDRDAVTAARADAAEDGIDLSGFDDHYVYVAFVVIGSEDDWTDLLKVIFERSAPQEAAIQAHIAAFPADVSGPGSV